MKKKLLAACVAALTFTGAGCDEGRNQVTSAPRTSQAPRVEPPAIASRVVHTPEVFDAGVRSDFLAIEHDDGRVIDHLARVNELRSQGDLKGALAEARRALFDEPNDEHALRQIDAIARLLGNKALRVDALARLGELAPADSTPLVHQARVLVAMKEFDRAVEVGTVAMTRNANDPEVYQVIGRAHLSKGELSAAITMFEKVIGLQPDHGYALNNLGFAYLRANRDEEAVEVLSRASELLPHVAFVFNNLGVALERTERLDEAKEAYNQASFLSPKYVKAQVNQARLAALMLQPHDIAGSMTDTMLDIALEATSPEE